MAFLLLTVSAIFFSTMEVVSKPLMGRFDPLFLTFLRFLIGGAFLMIFTRSKVPLSVLWRLSLIGALNSVVAMGILQLAVSLGYASEAATLISCNPLFVTLMAPFILKEPLNVRKILSIITGTVGVIVIGFGKLSNNLAFVLGIISAFVFAFYLVLLKPYSKKFGPLAATAYSSLFSLIFYVPVLVLSDAKISSFNLPGDLLRLLYLGLGTTGIAYYTFFKAAEIVGMVKASMVSFVKPAIAVVTAVILINERPTWLSLSGVLVVMFALFLSYERKSNENLSQTRSHD